MMPCDGARTAGRQRLAIPAQDACLPEKDGVIQGRHERFASVSEVEVTVIRHKAAISEGPAAWRAKQEADLRGETLRCRARVLPSNGTS
jgi:hypothetical protein